MIEFACKKFNIKEIIKCSLNLRNSDLEVIEFLMKQEQPSRSSHIKKQLNLDLSTIQRSLKKLTAKNILIRQQINLENGGYTYKYLIKDKSQIRKMISSIIDNWATNVKQELKKW
jgi:predicted transcriptional regulator